VINGENMSKIFVLLMLFLSACRHDNDKNQIAPLATENLYRAQCTRLTDSYECRIENPTAAPSWILSIAADAQGNGCSLLADLETATITITKVTADTQEQADEIVKAIYMKVTYFSGDKFFEQVLTPTIVDL